MESALFEIHERRVAGVAAGAFGEDEYRLTVATHLVGGALEHLHGRVAVAAIDEDGAGQGHELAEERRQLQRPFRRDGAVPGEDLAQEGHVQFGLVVAHDHAGAGLGQPCGALRVGDVESDPAPEGDELGESVARDMLGRAVEAEWVGDEGVEGAEGGGQEEGEEGCKGSVIEGDEWVSGGAGGEEEEGEGGQGKKEDDGEVGEGEIVDRGEYEGR